jgi:hypothetical protein
MQLTTHLHIVPGLRMSGAFSLFPRYAFVAWAGKTLSFYCFMCTYFYFYAMNYLQALIAAGPLKILLRTQSTCVIFNNLIYFNDYLRSLIDILTEHCSKVYY